MCGLERLGVTAFAVLSFAEIKHDVGARVSRAGGQRRVGRDRGMTVDQGRKRRERNTVYISIYVAKVPSYSSRARSHRNNSVASIPSISLEKRGNNSKPRAVRTISSSSSSIDPGCGLIDIEYEISFASVRIRGSPTIS